MENSLAAKLHKMEESEHENMLQKKFAFSSMLFNPSISTFQMLGLGKNFMQNKSLITLKIQYMIAGTISVVAKKLGCRLKIKLRQLKEGLKLSVRCALLIHHWSKIQPVIAAFSDGEFRRQPALSDNTAQLLSDYLSVEQWSTCNTATCWAC